MELPFIERDKLLHAVAGNYAALAGAVVAWYFTLPMANGAALAALAAAVGKEAWDYFSGKGTPDMADVSATMAGALPVCLVALA